MNKQTRNYIQKRALRKARKAVIEAIILAIMGTALMHLAWWAFDSRLTYKECQIYKTRDCDWR